MRQKEGRNVLFNDVLNTLYGVIVREETRCRHMGYAFHLDQVRSEYLKCIFRASWCSARLSRAQIPDFAYSSVRDKKQWGGGEELGETACTGGYKRILAVRVGSLAGGAWFEVLWNLECPVGLSQKRNMCAFQ